MALKASNRVKIEIGYLDNVYVFTVRHFTRAEMAAFRALEAETEAIQKALATGDTAAVAEIGKEGKLVPLVDSQCADFIIEIQEKKGDALTPAVFDVESGEGEKVWADMTPAERVKEIEISRPFFHTAWRQIQNAAMSPRVLGK